MSLHIKFTLPIISICLAIVGLRLEASQHGFYRVSRTSEHSWRMIAPSGDPMTWLGVDHVKFNGFRCEAEGNRMRYREANIRKFVTRPAWATNTIGRLRNWGFNALGAGCDNQDLKGFGFGRTVFLKMGATATGEKDDHEHYLAENLHVPGTAFPNVFNADFESTCDRVAAKTCRKYRDDHEIMGYFIDNELSWEGRNRGVTRHWGLFDAACAKPEGNSARIAVESFLAERGLKIGDEIPMDVRMSFVGMIAERYFAVTSAAIRKHDPNHLVLGCRFAGVDYPDCIWVAAGRHCDIVTLNAYARAELDRNEVLLSRGGEYHSIRTIFDELNRLSGRPLLITEWSFPALDSGLPCTRGAGQRFDTQDERARASELYARTVLALPYVVGYDYFMWVDMPAKGISFGYPEDTNYGLIREDGTEYENLTRSLAAVQRDVDAVRKAGVPPSRKVHADATLDVAGFLDRYDHASDHVSDLPCFVQNGGSFVLSNSVGIVLEGAVGSRSPIERMMHDGVNYGTLSAAVQLKGKLDPRQRFGYGISTVPVSKVKSVNYGAVDGRGRLSMTCVAKSGTDVDMELDLELFLAPLATQCVCSVVAVRNVGTVPAPVHAILVRPFSPFAGTLPKQKMVAPSFFNRPSRSAAWIDERSGNRIDAFTDSLFLQDIGFWYDAKGNQHPDISFTPMRPVRGKELTLTPGMEWKPESRICVRLSFGTTLKEFRREETMSEGWKFHRENAPEGDFLKERFDDSGWETVDVPHDWAIAGPFDFGLKDGATGNLPWKGIGVYRRSFLVVDKDLEGSVLLDFDGVMSRPKVYVNGRLVGGWDYGYMSFRVDASDFVRAGTNSLVVVADTRNHRSRWYPGAGIYRKVVLRTRPKARFAHNGIAITTPVAEKDRAVVRVAWELENTNHSAFVAVDIVCGGKTIATRKVAAGLGKVDIALDDPALWDIDHPVMHTAICRLQSNGTVSEERIRFGIRKIEFPVGTDRNDRVTNGFHLNGRRVELKGVNLHDDCGLLGRAYNRSVKLRQLRQMMDMGANALRTSHNPVSPETLDLCDELGMLVWDECFDKWDDTASRLPEENLEEYIGRNLRAFVRRDRNHPSVIVWSMGNEIGGWAEEKKGFTSDPSGLTRERCALFRLEMRKEDVTRLIGNGNMPHMAKPKFFERKLWDDLDILGWNYLGSHETAKSVYPDKAIVYSEFASPASTYGFYVGPSTKLYSFRGGPEHAAKQIDSYDLGTTIDISDFEFDRLERSPYCAGGFVWTGSDYLGEPIPFTEHARSSYFGNVDLTGVPKDRFWQYRAYWRNDRTTVHILPHWNWQGKEGQVVPVFVYTNGDSAELFINGRSYGRKWKGECELPGGRTNACYRVCGKYRLMWFDTVYEPGEVRAVAYRGNQCIGESTMRTASSPIAVRLTPESTELPADGETMVFVEVDVVDANGVRNPLAMDRVTFDLVGPGRIVAVGNGNPRGNESFKEISGHSLFYGKAMVVVCRDRGAVGDIELTATIPNLTAGKVLFSGNP